MNVPTLLSCLAAIVPTAPDLATRQRLNELRSPPPRGVSIEARERAYQTLLHGYTSRNVARLYASIERPRVRVFYADFVPAGGPRGNDLGYGLHVVRRREFPTANGARIVEVNEQWEEDPATGGLFPPDGIRAKIRFEGNAHAYFDSFRAAWASDGSATLWRATRFRWSDELATNRRVRMRVPVSAPLSCLGCHHARNPFAREFLRPGETPEPESIVQPGRFDEPLADGPGYRAYVAHRVRRGDDPRRIAFARAFLDSGLWNRWTEALGNAVERASAEVLPWLDDDRFATPAVVPRWRYDVARATYADALGPHDRNERLAVP